EKALQRFSDEYIEKRRRLAEDAARRLDEASEELDDICNQLGTLLKLREDALLLQERIISTRKDPLTPEEQIEQFDTLSQDASEINSQVRATFGRGKADEAGRPKRPAPSETSSRTTTDSPSAKEPLRRDDSRAILLRLLVTLGVAGSLIVGFSIAYIIFGRH